MSTAPNLREAAQIAQAFIRWSQFGECRTPGWDGPPLTADEADAALSAALSVSDEPAAIPQGYSHLIRLAAWLLSPEPTRHFDKLEENNLIGHRQFAKAQEDTDEVLRLKAIEIRALADNLAAPHPPPPVATPMMSMTPMLLASGRTGWYISGPEFYCEIETEPDGKYCIFFRDKSGNDGFFDPVDDQTESVEPVKPLTDDQIEDLRRDQEFWRWKVSESCFLQVARAIEAAHGIQGAKE